MRVVLTGMRRMVLTGHESGPDNSINVPIIFTFL